MMSTYGLHHYDHCPVPEASLLLLASLVVPAGGEARAEPKAEKVFAAVITDAQGIETEIENVVFYWQEKVNGTSFVLTNCGISRSSA